MYIDEKLSWKYHIDKVTSKISKVTREMAKARHYLSLRTLKAIYDTMVWPYLTYCNMIWSSTYQIRLKPLFLTQKKLVRLTTFTKYNEESKPIFRQLNLLNIHELSTNLTALFMHSFFNQHLPNYFTNSFILLFDFHTLHEFRFVIG